MTTFCIVTPVRNGAKYIDMAITHIVSQAGDFRIRYHIQDGGSTDGTLERIKRWEKILASANPIIQCQEIEFSWASEKDKGMYDAINKGYARMGIRDPQAIMGWCNSDDLYMPMTFSAVSKIFADLPGVNFIAGKWYRQENGLSRTSLFHGNPYPRELMAAGCCDTNFWTSVAQPSTFWRKSLWDKAGGLDASLTYCGDYDLWRRFAGFATCYFFPRYLSVAIMHEGQLGRRPPRPGEPTEYEDYYGETEKIVPRAGRLRTMKRFWGRRLLPPKGKYIEINGNDQYEALEKRCWPLIWGTGWHAYFNRRRLYFQTRLTAGLKKLFNRNRQKV